MKNYKIYCKNAKEALAVKEFYEAKYKLEFMGYVPLERDRSFYIFNNFNYWCGFDGECEKNQSCACDSCPGVDFITAKEFIQKRSDKLKRILEK